VVATIGDRPNIIWETCNEKRAGDFSTPAASAADPFHRGIADAIRATEKARGLPAHLVMPVDLPEHRTVAGHKTPSNGQSGEESVGAMHVRMAGAQFAWKVPLISDNDCCPGEPDAATIRRKAWAALTAGGHVDVFNNELYRRSVLENKNTADGMRWVGLVARFVAELGVDLAGMVPLDHRVDHGAMAIGRDGEEYVVYVPGGAGSVTILGLPTEHAARWFNPREGGAQDAPPGPAFTPPDGQDWALHVLASGGGGGTCEPTVVTFPGRFHSPTPQAARFRRDIPLDAGAAFARVEVEVDFVRGPWSDLWDPAEPDIRMHNIFWLHRGDRGGDWMNNEVFEVYLNSRHEQINMDTNLGILDQGVWNQSLGGGLSTQEGSTYHAKAVYDAAAGTFGLTVSQGGSVLFAKERADAAVTGWIRGAMCRDEAQTDCPKPGMFVVFGNDMPATVSPECPSLGWHYENGAVRLYPVPGSCGD
jgi:hypothetical protein